MPKTLMCKTELLLELINQHDPQPTGGVIYCGNMSHSQKGRLAIGISASAPARLVLVHESSGRAALVHITKLLESMAGELFKSSLL